MTRNRWLVVGAIVAALAALVGWQWTRERRIADCLESGGTWNGPKSLCDPPVRTILKRNIERG